MVRQSWSCGRDNGDKSGRRLAAPLAMQEETARRLTGRQPPPTMVEVNPARSQPCRFPPKGFLVGASERSPMVKTPRTLPTAPSAPPDALTVQLCNQRQQSRPHCRAISAAPTDQPGPLPTKAQRIHLPSLSREFPPRPWSIT